MTLSQLSETPFSKMYLPRRHAKSIMQPALLTRRVHVQHRPWRVLPPDITEQRRELVRLDVYDKAYALPVVMPPRRMLRRETP